MTYLTNFAKLIIEKDKEGDFMKIVLLKDVKNVGKKGDIVNVSDGYASNYLFPNKLAIPGNEKAVSEANQAKSAQAYHKEQERLAAVELGKKLQGITVTVSIKAGDTGKIFGSITNAQVASELGKLGFDIDKKKIELGLIKTLGSYSAKIKLHPTVSVTVNVQVVGA